MSAASILAWVVLPYLSIVLLVVGLVWRFRTDQFGWTSKSSQWQESTILRWSSPLFHLGILFVAIGHVMGLAIPQSLTDTLGVSHHLYHLIATIPGSIAGAAAVIGLLGLLYRRIVVTSVRLNTSRTDVLTYVLLTIPIVLGAIATFSTQVFGSPGGYNYRETISVWFRSIPMLHPQPELMADVPMAFKLHIIAGMLLFCIWPFTKLVHVVSAPVGYVTRPNVVYRSRESGRVASAPAARGWDRPFEKTDARRR
ncbi:respiratory nitrate reductase subunit gamma [Propionibacterium australiense]|uniref:Nitrate reductase-like protein NarX n=1 Tax=Propionibacterium australiense TaxID=119981 RepID=A0A383S7I4_9ACTN|nr:respiratory nitrate reductase subunit gamma [Propionibacterium australiense]RLP07611.1 respiratory nitrate reductase subunit gamma [Propionibacterium australiense]RLP08379.1 respiratory nitrate reductase subunit gamma [Propionibacterium australiense]SYZ33965.1 nitrate reductase [Propionibacterium australiense]VEH88942.1 Nitrate reductase-like protein narX [Propionibacterium australiense]